MTTNMTTKTAFISTIHIDGFCFGADPDTGDGIFVPKAVAQLMNIKPQSLNDFIVVPNTHHNSDQVQWKALGPATGATADVGDEQWARVIRSDGSISHETEITDAKKARGAIGILIFTENSDNKISVELSNG
jgi:hypothetical protein